jgi:hypothetical protein
VFTLFDDIERWLAPRAGKLLAEHPTPEPEGAAAVGRAAAGAPGSKGLG